MRSSTSLSLLSFFLSLFGEESFTQSTAGSAYAPQFETCPSGTSLLRQVGTTASAQTLSAGESAYVSARASDVLPNAWLSYYDNVRKASTSIDLPDYVALILNNTCQCNNATFPKLGIATSGGGYRAAIVGAGILNALDGRNKTSVSAGTGGLLQAATYLAGLSGGSWLVGSLSQADFPTIHDLIFGSSSVSGWQSQLDLLTPSSNVLTDGEYILDLIGELAPKYEQGFPVTMADVWARAISRHFVQGTTASNFYDKSLTHGAGITWSSITGLQSFTSHNQPFPIILGNTVTSKDNSSMFIEPDGFVPLQNPIYEFNAYEMGSWDPVLGAFTPIKYLGSPNSSICVTGYDQLSFIQGISSDLFIEYNVTTSGITVDGIEITPILAAIETLYPQTDIRLDSAAVPNPFFGVAPDVYPDADQTILTLVDGGMDGEVTPYQPLLVKARGVDTIFAIDAVADSDDNWAEGQSMIATQDRTKLYSSSYSFPAVPTTTDEFVSEGLTTRPTFFGCNADASTDVPLVIYVANGGPPLGEAPVTNTDTDDLEYPLNQVAAMLDQAFDIATQGITNGTDIKDPEWPACLACAVVDRSRRSLGVERSGVCASCMTKYCYN